MIPNLKILLADDNPDHVQLITEILYLELKAEVESVTKGEECLKKVIKNGYDLLLLDYLFPEISGLDILKEIIKKGNALPIIMLTGYGSEKVAVEAMKAGAIDYIVKSEDGFQSLSLAVIKAIEKDQLKKKLRQSEEKFKNLFESASDAIIYLDSSGRILDANIQAVEVFGVSKPEVLGKQLIRLGVVPPREIRAFLNSFADILAGREVIQDVCIKNKKGQEIALECSASLTKTDDKVTGVMFIARDITERKRAEEALRESEARLKEAQALGRIGSWEFDLDSRTVQWSDQVYRLYERDPAMGPPSVEEEAAYYSPEQAGILREYAQIAGEQGQAFEYDLEARLPSGRIARFAATMRPIRDRSGRIVKLFGTVQDITERKRAEEALRESEERFRTLYENSTIGLYRTTPDGRIHLANPALVRMLGYSSFDDLSTRNLKKDGFEPSYARTQFVEIIEKDGEVKGLESAWKRKDGIIIFIRESARAIRDSQAKTLYYDGTVEDITERKRAEEALRESELSHKLLAEYNRELNYISIEFAETRSEDELFERVANSFRTLTRAFGASTSRYDDQTNTLAVASVSVDANVGADVNAMLKGGLFSMKMSLLPPVQQQMLAQVIARPKTLTELTFGVVPEDVSTQIMRFLGIDRIIALSISYGADILGTVVSYQSGIEKHIPDEALKTFAYMAGIAFKKRRAEEALHVSEARLRAVLANAPVVMFAVDPAGVVTLAEGRGLTALGVTPEQIVGRRAYDFFPEQPLLQEGIQRALTGEAFSATGQVAGLWFDGRLTPLPGPDNRVVGAIGVAMDITERKRAEEEIRRKAKDLQEKNEELTRFTSSVSHDLRSPLVTIQTFQGHLERDIRSRDAVRVEKDLDYIRNAADKMGRLLDDLLRFSRVGRIMTPSEETPLQAIVKEALDLVAGRITGRGVRIDLAEEPVVLYGDRTRLVELFLNLVDNAVKFMGDEPAPRVEIGVEQAGEELVFHVRDNGIGIDPELQPMLFDLFHKLDPETEGEGIGLALVKRIVELHGGRIWVESEGLGKGTTFRFTLAKTRRRRAEEEKP